MTVIQTTCLIETPIYINNNKSYIDISLYNSDAEHVKKTQESSEHMLRGSRVQDPLHGATLKVKVPMRNGRTLCAMTGQKPLCAMVKGDKIDVKITYCGPWNYGDFCGFAWKLNQVGLSTIDYR